MNSPRKWTEEEDELLLAMKAAGKPLCVNAKKFQRTEMAVSLRMSQLTKRDSRPELRSIQ
jgi:hypothetical protein